MLKRFLPIIPICLALGMASQSAAAEITVEQLFKESHAVAERLKSIDMVVSCVFPGVGTRVMRLRERDGMLRGDGFFGPYVPDAEGENIQTFDGKTHLNFLVKTKQIGKTTKPTDASLMPFDDTLCLTYRWLMSLPLSWPQAKSQSRWLECATRAKLQTPTTVNGIPCQSVRIPVPNECWLIVEIADNLRIPLRWAEYDSLGIARQETLIREWKEYPTSSGTVVLPTVVDSIMRHGLGKEVKEMIIPHTVDLASVKINPQLSDDLFTIPLSRATEIYDKDAKEVICPEQGIIKAVDDNGYQKTEPPRRIPAKTSWNTVMVIGGLLAAVLAIVAIRFGSRRQGSF